jgi:hypothetical protein
LVEIASAPRTSNRDALWAAAYAFACEPSHRAHQKLLLRVAVRSILGRRADAACVSLYRRAKRMKPLAAEVSRAG